MLQAPSLKRSRIEQQVIIRESKSFTKRLLSSMSDDEYSLLQMALVRRPAAGVIIEGSGGIRKLRWSLPGRGKSGGVRIVYYWAVSKDVIFMLDIFAKNEKADLTKQEIKILGSGSIRGEIVHSS